MITLLSKFGIPVLIGIAVGVFGTLYIGKMIKPEIKLVCPQCPDVTCPPSVELNSVDLDKVGKKNNIHINNNISNVSINVDSAMFDALARKAGYKK